MHADSPTAVMGSQVLQDSLDSEQGETKAHHAHQFGQILHYSHSATQNLPAQLKAVFIPSAHILASLPALKGEVVLCVVNMAG